MYSNISMAASSRVAKVRACTHSLLTMPLSDSVTALSHGLATDPIDGRIPWRRMVAPSSSDMYCAPWSLWCTQPAGGRLRSMAILSASSASAASILGPIDQPTILLGHTSITTARQGRPWCVRT